MLKKQVVFFLFLLLPILIGVAYLTLFERKILAYSQNRKGPNKVRWLGLLQPISDAIKLFTAQIAFFISGCDWFFYSRPIIGLMLRLFLWVLYPTQIILWFVNFNLLIFLVVLGFSVYPLVLGGLGRSNKYAILGSYRRVAQIISYEVVIILFLIIFIFLGKISSFYQFFELKNYFRLIILFPSLILIWLLRALAETNRTPFDFSEGESELVSGFNTEYGRWWFTFIFLAEYSNILFFRCLRASLFSVRLGCWLVLRVVFIFIWVILRRTFPRHRFDKLMNLSWKSLIPFIVFLVFAFLPLNL